MRISVIYIRIMEIQKNYVRVVIMHDFSHYKKKIFVLIKVISISVLTIRRGLFNICVHSVFSTYPWTLRYRTYQFNYQIQERIQEFQREGAQRLCARSAHPQREVAYNRDPGHGGSMV